MARDRDARTADAKQRLFLAVEVPPAAEELVVAAIRSWREAFPDARWVAAELWHVTLMFLGWTEPRLVPWVERIVEGVVAGHPPVAATVQGFGAFPSTRRARVLWAGIDDPARGLADLVDDLGIALAERYPAEARPFHAHLTVARSDPPIRLPASYVETPLASEPFVVDRVVLFRSHPGRVTRYEPLRMFALGG